jgi:hypothetical protein
MAIRKLINLVIFGVLTLGIIYLWRLVEDLKAKHLRTLSYLLVKRIVKIKIKESDRVLEIFYQDRNGGMNHLKVTNMFYEGVKFYVANVQKGDGELSSVLESVRPVSKEIAEAVLLAAQIKLSEIVKKFSKPPVFLRLLRIFKART